jgi:ATP-dependent exoDNAse (exonuclease V) alpha subunit
MTIAPRPDDLPAPPDTRLSDDRRRLLESSARVLFVTGRAGTGKSTLLRYLTSQTRRNFVVLAPTGAAAVDVGGQTIHSFFKFKPGITAEDAYRMGMRNEEPIYKRLEVMVIDEISMVRADLLDCIDAFLQAARKKDEPFGGVQAVFFGDLYQLEPVVTRDEANAIGMQYESPYFFSSEVFSQLLRSTREQAIELLELTTMYRQIDPEFVGVLDRIRRDQLQEGDLDYINCQVDEYLDFARDGYVYLTDTNSLAQRINNENLAGINREPWTFTGKLSGHFNDKNLPTEMDLTLKVGARIMMLNNDPFKRWVNGTLGHLTHIEDDKVAVLLDDGREHTVERYIWGNHKFFFDDHTKSIKKQEVGSFEQFPLRLAWAITIHKSQGKTFDSVVIMLQNRAFAHGQTYVALSRCRTREGIILNRPVMPHDIISDVRVKKFMVSMKRYVMRWRRPVEDILSLVLKIERKSGNALLRLLEDDESERTISLADVGIVKESGIGEDRFLVSGTDTDTGERLFIPTESILSIEDISPDTLPQQDISLNDTREQGVTS